MPSALALISHQKSPSDKSIISEFETSFKNNLKGVFILEEIKIFNNQEFGDVRTIIIDGESFKNNA